MSMLTAKVHVFSDSVFCTGPGSLDSTSALTFLENTAHAVMKTDKSQNRNNIAGQSIDIELHVCPGDTLVQILHKLQEFMSETGHEP